MDNIFIFLTLLLLYPCINCRAMNGNKPLLNNKPEVSELNYNTHSFPIDYSWARQNKSCQQFMKHCLQYLESLPAVSLHYVGPALGLGLMQVGCISETDTFLSEFLRDEDTKEMLRQLFIQWKEYIPYHSNKNTVKKGHTLDTEVLRFNLVSFVARSLYNCTHCCSGVWHEKQGIMLKGIDIEIHKSLQEAKKHCKGLGSYCAGIYFNISGEFHVVKRNGASIVPQNGSRLWLQHCTDGRKWRRSVDSDCENEREQSIYNVVQWLPVVSGWYSAGTAVYYATQCCEKQAEDRAIEASLDLGYDALLVATSGASGFGVGAALKPAIKAGVRAAINYFKQQPEQNQTTQVYPQTPLPNMNATIYP
ncbi:apolipoprotein F [Bombina bombina]|uniref:apolipoprotein F n=1 Tax=Bombina bombina TaxID=8345 RepID=UPI00235A80C7|nr:apolipoprotein F [Bombina bombina]